MTEKVNLICYTLVISIVNIYNSDNPLIIPNAVSATRAGLSNDGIPSSLGTTAKEITSSKNPGLKEFRLNLFVPTLPGTPKKTEICMEYSDDQKDGKKTISFLIKKVAFYSSEENTHKDKKIKRQGETLIKGKLEIKAEGKGNLAEKFDKNYSLDFFQSSKFFGKDYLKIEVTSFTFFLTSKKDKQASQPKAQTISYPIDVLDKKLVFKDLGLSVQKGIEDYYIFDVSVIYKVSLYNEPKENLGQNPENYIGVYTKYKNFGETDESQKLRDFNKFYSELMKSRLSFLRKWLEKIEEKKNLLMKQKEYKASDEKKKNAFFNYASVTIDDKTLNSPLWESNFKTRIFYFEKRVEYKAIFFEAYKMIFLLVVPKELDVSNPSDGLKSFFAYHSPFARDGEVSFHFLTVGHIENLGYSCTTNEESPGKFQLSKKQDNSSLQTSVAPTNGQKTSSNGPASTTQTDPVVSEKNDAEGTSSTEGNGPASLSVQIIDQGIHTDSSNKSSISTQTDPVVSKNNDTKGTSSTEGNETASLSVQIIDQGIQTDSSNKSSISTQTDSVVSKNNDTKGTSSTEGNGPASETIKKSDREIHTQESHFITERVSTPGATKTNTQRRGDATKECSAITGEKTNEVAENQDRRNQHQNSNENTQTEGKDNLFKKIKNLKGVLLIVLGVVLIGICGSIYFIRRSKAGGDLEDCGNSLRDGGRDLWSNVDG